MPDEAREIGRNIEVRRLKLRMSRAELAVKTGLDPSAISRILNGDRGITLENLFRFAEALRCEVQDLLPVTEKSLVDYIVPTDPATKSDVQLIMERIDYIASILESERRLEEERPVAGPLGKIAPSRK